MLVQVSQKLHVKYLMRWVRQLWSVTWFVSTWKVIQENIYSTDQMSTVKFTYLKEFNPVHLIKATKNAKNYFQLWPIFLLQKSFLGDSRGRKEWQYFKLYPWLLLVPWPWKNRSRSTKTFLTGYAKGLAFPFCARTFLYKTISALTDYYTCAFTIYCVNINQTKIDIQWAQ